MQPAECLRIEENPLRLDGIDAEALANHRGVGKSENAGRVQDQKFGVEDRVMSRSPAGK